MGRVRYKFHVNLYSVFWSIIHILIFVGLCGCGYILIGGGFISAWLLSFIVAVALFMSLSIPRYIEVDKGMLTIYCMLDVTEINIDEIAVIRKVSPRKIRWTLPIFGSRGFFGYYGHYFDFRHFRRIIIYASEWRNLVEIIDIYEDHYYISCRQRNELINAVKEHIRSIEP